MTLKRTFVTSDTHGEAERFREVLKQAGFDYEHDELIHLGDTVDRGPDSYGVIEELLKIKNLVAIRGNHDAWFTEAIVTGLHPAPSYFGETLYSYMQACPVNDEGKMEIPTAHAKFLFTQINHYTDEKGRFFCHAGFDRHQLIDQQEDHVFYWDRDLFKQARSADAFEKAGLDGGERGKLNDVNNFSRIFIGHTPTLNYKENGQRITTPIYAAQVVNIDTGACFGGKLSLVDITDDANHILYQS